MSILQYHKATICRSARYVVVDVVKSICVAALGLIVDGFALLRKVRSIGKSLESSLLLGFSDRLERENIRPKVKRDRYFFMLLHFHKVNM